MKSRRTDPHGPARPTTEDPCPAAPYSPRHAASAGARQGRRRHGAPPASAAGRTPGPSARPGIAALLRRHPDRVRRAGIAAAGVAVTVLVASSVAGAATQTHRPSSQPPTKSAPLTAARAEERRTRALRRRGRRAPAPKTITTAATRDREVQAQGARRPRP